MFFWLSTPIRVLLIRVALYGCSLVLAGGVWAWAVGANAWHGVIVGAVLGLGAVIMFVPTSESESRASGDLSGLGYLLFRGVTVALLLALSVVGAIVGVVIRLAS